MNYWYYQISIKNKGHYVGVMETNKEYFPMSDINTEIQLQYEIDPSKITYNLIQQINREDYHSLYASGSGFKEKLND